MIWLINMMKFFAGSHDSFTQSMNACSDFGPDCPTYIKDICKLFRPTVKNIVYKWSVTQCLSFKQQLQAGIRYFDLRVATGKDGTENAYFSHGLLCSKVEPFLREVASFLEEHPKEVVLLDFNHFYKMNDTAHQQLYNLVLIIFGKKICPYIQTMEDRLQLTLNSLWEKEQQIIVFYQCDFAKSCPELWPAPSIRAPWGNTCDVTKLMSFLEDSYNYRHKGPMADIFYVCQGILTPDFRYMVGHFMGNLRDDLAVKVCQQVIVSPKDRPVGDAN